MGSDNVERFLKGWLEPVDAEQAGKTLSARALKLPTNGSSQVPNRRKAYLDEVTAVTGRVAEPLTTMHVRIADLAGLGAALRDVLPTEPTRFPPPVRELVGQNSAVLVGGDILVDRSIFLVEASGILRVVRNQAVNSRHNIRNVASFDEEKFLTDTELPPPFSREFTWCPTMSNKAGDSIGLHHRFESALVLAGSKFYTGPEVEELRERMIREGLNITDLVDPNGWELMLTVGGEHQTLQVDFGLSPANYSELLRKRRSSKFNNHGRIGLPNFVHIKSSSPGRTEWFSFDRNEEGIGFEERIREYWELYSKIRSALCSLAPELVFNVSNRRNPDPQLGILDGAKHTF